MTRSAPKALPCPVCLTTLSKVENGRPHWDGTCYRRFRRCHGCQQRFLTEERVVSRLRDAGSSTSAEM